MLNSLAIRIDDKKMIAFIPPPIAPPDRDLELLDPEHEVLLAVNRECLLEPKHLREEVDLFYECELPGLEFGEVLQLEVVAEGSVVVVSLVGWSCG